MSIVNLLQIGKQLVAACDNGWLILWDIQEEIDITITDIDGIAPSLGSSKHILRIAPQLKGLQQIGDKLIGFNVTTLYVMLKADIYKTIEQGKLFKSITTIKLSQGASQIQCVKAVDEKMLMIGTDDNYLYKYNLNGRKVDQRIKVYIENIAQNKMKLFCPEPQQKVRVISICLDSDCQQALIGLSNGHIYKVSVIDLKIISQFPTYASSLIGLMAMNSQKCFLSVHQDCILCWNATTGESNAKVQVSSASGGINLVDNIYLTIGMYPELHWVSEAAVHSIGITPRISSCVKMVTVGSKRYVAVGGSDGIVDVFCKNKHILVLFPKVDRVID